jgi:hypothetical protein
MSGGLKLEGDKLQLERDKVERDSDNQAAQATLEREKLQLERYKAERDYKKFVLASVFVALAVAAIPPSFQLATAALEYVKSSAERLSKQQEFRDAYIKEFISNALNQDIELRIRFAQYFARVSTEPSRQDWLGYLKDLKETRDGIRRDIDQMEEKWNSLSSVKERDNVELAWLERHLAWAYNEVGYVEKNRSAAANPRAPEGARTTSRDGSDVWSCDLPNTITRPEQITEVFAKVLAAAPLGLSTSAVRSPTELEFESNRSSDIFPGYFERVRLILAIYRRIRQGAAKTSSPASAGTRTCERLGFMSPLPTRRKWQRMVWRRRWPAFPPDRTKSEHPGRQKWQQQVTESGNTCVLEATSMA